MIKKYLFLIVLLYSCSNYAQTLVSQYDFLNSNLGVATVGNDAVGYNTTDAKLAAGGGVYFIHSGGSTGLDLEISRSDFQNLSSVTFSFDYKRLESYATFFEMDYFKFRMNGGQVIIDYKVKDNSNIITFNTGYYIPNQSRALIKVTYDAATGTMSVYENTTLKASNVTTAGKALDWPLTGNAFIGRQMDGSGSATASLYQFQIYDVASSTLPIQLLNFNARVQNKNINLDWKTATEQDNDYFIVERSKDGVIAERVGIVQGAGNSNSVINYEIIDNQPYTGVSYYRLTQVDYNGLSETFDWIAVNIPSKKEAALDIYPNPLSNGNLNMNLRNISSQTSIIIYDFIGRVVYQDIKNIDSENQHLQLHLDLAKGAYNVQVVNEQQIILKKLIVK